MATASDRSSGLGLALAALLALAAGCHDEPVAPSAALDAGTDAKIGEAGAKDAPGTEAAAAEVIDCFMGIPKTNDELLNQCWPEEVATIVKKPALPGGYAIGMPLPPPP
jgi:hypothetical protein